MKKKGFTLIELLAVIVILAVIALIATPAVLNIIEDSKKSAAEASARNIASAAKAYYMSNLMNDISTDAIDLSKSSFKYDGEQATKGYITYDAKGNVTGKMYVSGYCIEITESNTTSEKVDESECTIDIVIPTKTYTNGEIVYYNPVTNTKCSDYNTSLSATGVKEGCMKWYAFLDNENSNTVKLLLDHNTTAQVAFKSGIDSPAITKVSDDTANWNSSVKSTARLISEKEIANIIGISNWNYTAVYLHSGSNKEYKGNAGTNKYAWLFDYSNSCTTYGCNTSDSTTYGYWTSNTGLTIDEDAWAVAWTGNLRTNMAENSMLNGIRPVIEVSKNILK